MPVAVQSSGTTAAEPPASTIKNSALHHRNIVEDARGAAVVVVVDGAETKAVLVDSFVGTSDGVTFGKMWKFRIQMVHLKGRKKQMVTLLNQMLLLSFIR